MSAIERTLAAQYVRMSTETQTLSPAIQKEAIHAYALARNLTVIRSYEDEGKSGLTLRQRPEMQRLLRDVAGDNCPFSLVLVYDVSRWGRFQDTDESAYYEYHCRLHGVSVVYVAESFDSQMTPISALMKAAKRAMAAEFSRELAVKVSDAQRSAVSLGFQIGRTPCIGIDRTAVSGRNEVRPLSWGERSRKGERIRWIPGPTSELDLVRKIFSEYANSDITLEALSARLNQEGYSARGRAFTRTMVTCLIDAEIFRGDFIWGQRKSGRVSQRRADDDPRVFRSRDIVPATVSSDLWDKAQAKRKYLIHVFKNDRHELIEDLRAALVAKPGLSATELRGNGCAPAHKYQERFGSLREAMRLAGRDEVALRRNTHFLTSRLHRLSNRFKSDLANLITAAGINWSSGSHQHVFVLEKMLRLRFKLIWRADHRGGPRWHFNRNRGDWGAEYLLLVLMEEDDTAKEFLVLSASQYKSLHTWFIAGGGVGEARIFSGAHLVEHLKMLCPAPPLDADPTQLPAEAANLQAAS